VDFSDWLLALHVLAAFALIGALVLFSAVMVAGWAVDRPRRAIAYSRLAAVGGPLVGAGARSRGAQEGHLEGLALWLRHRGERLLEDGLEEVTECSVGQACLGLDRAA